MVTEIYGGTEGTATFITSEEWLEHPGSVGRAGQATELSVRDEHGNPLSAGEVGLIYFRSTLPTFLSRRRGQDGKVPVERDDHAGGDLGYLDEAGYLYVTGRDADLTISGGVNIYPAEVEHALLEVPGVIDACVVGRKDERWGRECPCRCSGFRPR